MKGKIIREQVEENVSKRLISFIKKESSKLECQMSASIHNIKCRQHFKDDEFSAKTCKKDE